MSVYRESSPSASGSRAGVVEISGGRELAERLDFYVLHIACRVVRFTASLGPPTCASAWSASGASAQ